MNIIGIEADILDSPDSPDSPTQSPSRSRQAIRLAVQAGSIKSIELLLQSNLSVPTL